jgi:hypothetical protein
MTWRTLMSVLVFGAALPALATTVGQGAPNFTLMDTHGRTVQLSNFKGQYIVLEWTNPACPFVLNHYNTGNMQTLQQTWGARGVVWLAIDSSNRSGSDYLPPAKLDEWMQARGAAQKAVLMDPDSAAAKLFQAKTTPHMFVINPAGTIVYAGAIDDRPSTRPEDPAAAHNYVRAALTEAAAGVALTTPASTPYGCSIQY